MSVNRSQSIPPDAPVDLTNCDREPIHTPGAIQAHGALFALDPVTLRILAASENAERFTGIAVARIVNARGEDVFGREIVERIQAAALEPNANNLASFFSFSDAYTARVHVTADTLYVELEPVSTEAPQPGIAGAAAGRFAATEDIVGICDDAAATVRDLTGYDRVMVYRFDSDGHGSVISEARAERLDAFLGQHYPASDIPRQARELYRTTVMRLIVDVGYVPAPVVPLADPRSGAPWDLGRALLRSVSPIHIQYLKNMGVAATCTYSLLRHGELWGLIAAHHYSPKYVANEVRWDVVAVGNALVDRIVALEDSASRAKSAALHAAVATFAGGAGAHERVRAVATDAALHRALGWDGAALANGAVTRSGVAPGEERIAALATWLDERKGVDRFVTDNLTKLNPEFGDIARVASGVYAHRSPAGWLFGFRAEFEHEIVWGGDPNKAASFDGERLSPRGSFEKWREEVHERAIPWEPETLEALDKLVAWMEGTTPWS